MLGDFEPIVHELEGRTIKVWAVADMHIGSRECDLDGFKAFLKSSMSDPQYMELEFTGTMSRYGSIQVHW